MKRNLFQCRFKRQLCGLTVWVDTEQCLHQIPRSGDARHIKECVHDIGQALREAPSLPSLGEQRIEERGGVKY
jgi:hypothetical protein